MSVKVSIPSAFRRHTMRVQSIASVPALTWLVCWIRWAAASLTLNLTCAMNRATFTAFP